jgi:hypothetical protein
VPIQYRPAPVFDATDYITQLLSGQRSTLQGNYGRARTDLDGKYQQGRQAIGQSYADFAGATARTGADYNAEAARINSSISQAQRESEAAIKGGMSAVSADLKNQGADTTALGAATGSQLAASQNQGALQAALAQRLQQLSAQSAADTQGAGANVRQGAEGQLVNNNSDILARLLADETTQLGAVEAKGQELYMGNQRDVAEQNARNEAQRMEVEKFNAQEAADQRRMALQAQLQRESNAGSPEDRQMKQLQLEKMRKELEKTGAGDPATLLDADARNFALGAPSLDVAWQDMNAYLGATGWDGPSKQRFRDAIGSQITAFFQGSGQPTKWDDKNMQNVAQPAAAGNSAPGVGWEDTWRGAKMAAPYVTGLGGALWTALGLGQ